MTSDHVPKDHKVRLKTYLKSFTGEEFIKWLQIRKEVEKVEEGVILGQALLEHGVIHHGEGEDTQRERECVCVCVCVGGGGD